MEEIWTQSFGRGHLDTVALIVVLWLLVLTLMQINSENEQTEQGKTQNVQISE